MFFTIFIHLYTPCGWIHILFDHGKPELQDKQHDDKIITPGVGIEPKIPWLDTLPLKYNENN
jgi:hypothetical protein